MIRGALSGLLNLLSSQPYMQFFHVIEVLLLTPHQPLHPPASATPTPPGVEQVNLKIGANHGNRKRLGNISTMQQLVTSGRIKVTRFGGHLTQARTVDLERLQDIPNSEDTHPRLEGAEPPEYLQTIEFQRVDTRQKINVLVENIYIVGIEVVTMLDQAHQKLMAIVFTLLPSVEEQTNDDAKKRDGSASERTDKLLP